MNPLPTGSLNFAEASSFADPKWTSRVRGGATVRGGLSGVPRSYETASPKAPTVGLCLGPYAGPRGEGHSYERGTPVHDMCESYNILASSGGRSIAKHVIAILEKHALPPKALGSGREMLEAECGPRGALNALPRQLKGR
jgi:hypothetical protein